jgi:hypothetical protein
MTAMMHDRSFVLRPLLLEIVLCAVTMPSRLARADSIEIGPDGYTAFKSMPRSFNAF